MVEPTGVETPPEVVEEVVAETPAVVEAPAEEAPIEEAPAEEVVESAEDLKKKLEEVQAENERLRASKPEPEKQKPVEGRKSLMVNNYVNTVRPKSKTDFSNISKEIEKAISVNDEGHVVVDGKVLEQVAQKQFDTLMDTSESMVNAIYTDHVHPNLYGLATSIIDVSNEIEILNLRSEVPNFKDHEKELRESLGKMTYADRSPTPDKPSPVRDIYHKIVGSKSIKKEAPKVVTKTAPNPTLKDIAAGKGGSPVKPSTVKLTPEQEKDRLEMGDEVGSLDTPEQYWAKYQARVAKAKASNKPIPKTLRDLI